MESSLEEVEMEVEGQNGTRGDGGGGGALADSRQADGGESDFLH